MKPVTSIKSTKDKTQASKFAVYALEVEVLCNVVVILVVTEFGIVVVVSVVVVVSDDEQSTIESGMSIPTEPNLGSDSS